MQKQSSERAGGARNLQPRDHYWRELSISGSPVDRCPAAAAAAAAAAAGPRRMEGPRA